MSQFGIEDLQPVMVTDAGVESHPIVVPVYKPTEINAVFDSISYSKVKGHVWINAAMPLQRSYTWKENLNTEWFKPPAHPNLHKGCNSA